MTCIPLAEAWEQRGAWRRRAARRAMLETPAANGRRAPVAAQRSSASRRRRALPRASPTARQRRRGRSRPLPAAASNRPCTPPLPPTRMQKRDSSAACKRSAPNTPDTVISTRAAASRLEPDRAGPARCRHAVRFLPAGPGYRHVTRRVGGAGRPCVLTRMRSGLQSGRHGCGACGAAEARRRQTVAVNCEPEFKLPDSDCGRVPAGGPPPSPS